MQVVKNLPGGLTVVVYKFAIDHPLLPHASTQCCALDLRLLRSDPELVDARRQAMSTSSLRQSGALDGRSEETSRHNDCIHS